VPVRGDDYERLGDAAEALTVWNGVRCFMAMRDDHCAALRLEPESGRYLCSVYEQRPETCRALERGSPECAGERYQKQERARRALRVY
jgi:Fe-S-cluster containining protein